jgi:hypothetical protein
MTISDTQRNFARNYSEFPIMFTNYNSKTYFDAKTLNSSVDGMCFESGCALKPGFNISIRKLNDMPDMDYDPEAYKILKATVMWCKKIKSKYTSRYGIGVKFLRPTSC